MKDNTADCSKKIFRNEGQALILSITKGGKDPGDTQYLCNLQFVECPRTAQQKNLSIIGWYTYLIECTSGFESSLDYESFLVELHP